AGHDVRAGSELGFKQGTTDPGRLFFRRCGHEHHDLDLRIRHAKVPVLRRPRPDRRSRHGPPDRIRSSTPPASDLPSSDPASSDPVSSGPASSSARPSSGPPSFAPPSSVPPSCAPPSWAPPRSRRGRGPHHPAPPRRPRAHPTLRFPPSTPRTDPEPGNETTALPCPPFCWKNSSRAKATSVPHGDTKIA